MKLGDTGELVGVIRLKFYSPWGKLKSDEEGEKACDLIERLSVDVEEYLQSPSVGEELDRLTMTVWVTTVE